MEKEIVQITILGTSFSITSDEDPAYVEELVTYFKRKIGDIEKSVSSKDPLRISILAGLLIADELYKIRNKSRFPKPEENRSSEEAARLTKEMIERLDRSLRDYV